MITRYKERYAMLTDLSYRCPASFMVHTFVSPICWVLASSSLYHTCGVFFLIIYCARIDHASSRLARFAII